MIRMYKQLIASVLLKITPNRIRKLFFYDWQSKRVFHKFENQSFSQEGEDRILRRIFEGKKSGFYVDVGAHHPFRFSNTYVFYLSGWRGINIEPRKESKVLFDRYRSEDLNLEIGISAEGVPLEYYELNETALNTFCEKEALLADKKGSFRICSQRQVETKTLRAILEEHLPTGKHIDFMSVDVEGMDLNVLNSNDWNLFRPSYLLVEVLRCELLDINLSEIGRFLANVDYIPISKTFNTFIFEDRKIHGS